MRQKPHCKGYYLDLAPYNWRQKKVWYQVNHSSHYWIQVQIQLEVCDLDECCFQQCILKEYETKEEFFDDKSVKYKGIVVDRYNPELKKKDYFYPDKIIMDYDEMYNWAQTIECGNITYWKLEDMMYTDVPRDLTWFSETLPKIEDFWKDVLYYRRHGLSEILPEKRKKKPAMEFLDDSDDSNDGEDTINTKTTKVTKATKVMKTKAKNKANNKAKAKLSKLKVLDFLTDSDDN